MMGLGNGQEVAWEIWGDGWWTAGQAEGEDRGQAMRASRQYAVEPAEPDAPWSRLPDGAQAARRGSRATPADRMASADVSYSDAMSVTRIVPNPPVADVSNALELYRDIFGFDIGMDLGWVGNLAPADSRTGRRSHPLTDEPWGVRRFFFRDPDGNIVNVTAHH